MSNTELRDSIVKLLYETAVRPEFRFGIIATELAANKYRLGPDIECELADELSSLGKDCCIKAYGKGYYVFNGLIYVPVDEELIGDAFRFFMSKVGIKVAVKKRIQLLKCEFLVSVRINSRLKPRLDIVAFSNGVLDLHDYSFHEPSPEFHVIYQHKYKYNPNAKCTLWQRFLREVLPDKTSRAILQMFLGLGLIERGSLYNPFENKGSNKIELCLILLGSGANGKSVIYQTAMGLFGSDRISGVDYDELTSSGDEGMRSRRLLRDAIFNWSSDSDARTFGKKRTGVFKRIVSGEPVTDRGIGENVAQNFNLPYLIFNLNELPYPDDTSFGFIRRLQFISFDVTIPAAKQNKGLAAELTEEYSGIFNWVARGAKELKRRRFVFPSSEGNRRQMLLAQLGVNPTLAWVSCYGCRPNSAVKGEQFVRISSEVVLESMKRFCSDNDCELPSMISIGHTLSRLGFNKRATATGKDYDMYGVSRVDLMHPFVIKNEQFDMMYNQETESYIKEED